ncbi:tRNA (guanine-N(7)-)-methyltransferase non-catalytic subunit wuho [Trichoplusia ni]|uniref:tRNA (Guanine-N(7)-)-methyltransferase non-catalytic subunit wuho n=1 Tax=Trichoplusia ni TaxID=7111 RepID=A0A7E5W9K8_TRINI|nr:tRNA (guanine-N(7)-)-methyltransferase non-catalytic subunit wuho [Trichoplusia ni]
MSLLVATDKYIALAKDLHIDYYDYTDHKIVDIPLLPKQPEKDYISDIAVSNDAKHLALVTASSKQLMIYDLCKMEHQTTFIIPRSASRIRFTVDNTKLLVADKSGDVLIYDIMKKDSGTKLLGHLSLLLDVLQSNDSKYIISCDRDEKIKVSCYPKTYSIQTYCLGHKEYVNHIEFLPHNDKYLTSSSGDGTLKIWDYSEGKLYHTIDTKFDVKDEQLRQNFINIMDEGGIEVATLPIVHYTTTKNNNSSSLLAITVHSYNAVIIYSVTIEDNSFSHKLEKRLELPRFPAAINLFNKTLFVYDNVECNINVFKIVAEGGNFSLEEPSKIAMFKNKNIQSDSEQVQLESIKVLYKRKFDNVQEYQERKKLRLQKSTK